MAQPFCPNCKQTSSSDIGTATITLTAPATSDPSTPEDVEVSRNEDYTEATLAWENDAYTEEYEVGRLAAVVVQAGDASRIEYGDPVTFTVPGTVAWVTEYTDTVAPETVYQYRIRAMGRNDATWSTWTSYVFSGAQRQAADLAAPANFRLTRGDEDVVISWTDPGGTFTDYTLQREELITHDGSALFSNRVTLGSPWLTGASTTYTDATIFPGRTYQYRVAAVNNDQVGEYSDWSRAAPVDTSLGSPPANFRLASAEGRILGDRREFWTRWDPVLGADDYEVQVLAHTLPPLSAQSAESFVVTDNAFFRTGYARTDVRVRARKQDSALCGSGSDDYCLTGWSAWATAIFTPDVEAEIPPEPDDASDTSLEELRTDTEEIFEEVIAPLGADVDGTVVIEILSVAVALGLAGLSLSLSWRRGMAPIGVGMGAAILVLVLLTSHRLYGIPLSMAIGAQVIVGVLGIIALVRQLGVLRS